MLGQLQQPNWWWEIVDNLHNNTLSRRRRTTMTVRSNDTLVDTPFQLIVAERAKRVEPHWQVMWTAARDICMYVCMYVYVRRALGPITLRACVAGAESALFEIYFYRERKLWKKRSLAQEWARTWVWCIADHCLYHRANGALAALDFKFGSYTVDCCSECWLQWDSYHGHA